MFQIIKKNSKIDLFFFIVFFVGLTFATININNANISENENRTLAILKPFTDKNGKIDYEFGHRYEKWLKDRFYLREHLISLYSNLIYKMNFFVYKSNKIFVMKDSHYFLGDGGTSSVHRSSMWQIGNNLRQFNEYLSQKGIKFYVITHPSKNHLFRSYNLIYNKHPTQNRQNKNYLTIEAVEKKLNEKYGVKHIDVENMYKDAMKKELPMYKTDHHSTDYGYFLIYTKLMSVIQNDFPDIKIHGINDFKLSKNKLVRHNKKRTFHLGIEHSQSNVRDEDVFDVEYTFFDYKDLNKITVRHKDRNHQFHTNPDGKYKLLLIGDSSIDSFLYFLNTSFSQIDAYRVNQKKYPFEVKPFYKTIDSFKPDIVIFFRQSGAISQFNSMYPESNKGEK